MTDHSTLLSIPVVPLVVEDAAIVSRWKDGVSATHVWGQVRHDVCAFGAPVCLDWGAIEDMAEME